MDYESKRDFVNSISRIQSQISETKNNIKLSESDEKKLIQRQEGLMKDINVLSNNISSKNDEVNVKLEVDVLISEQSITKFKTLFVSRNLQ